MTLERGTLFIASHTPLCVERTKQCKDITLPWKTFFIIRSLFLELPKNSRMTYDSGFFCLMWKERFIEVA